MLDNDPNPSEESAGHVATHVDPATNGVAPWHNAVHFDPMPELNGSAIGHVATHVVPL